MSRTTRKSWFLLLLLLTLPTLLIAQGDYRFKIFTTDDGLSQNSVNCIFQDNEGFLWLGTQDGLCRYDGYEFKQFRHDRNDPGSMSDNFVLSIVEDHKGYIWFTTRNGINRMHKQTGKCQKFFLDTIVDYNQYQSIAIDHDGMLWISHMSGVYKINPQKNYKQHNIMNDMLERVLNQYSGDICILRNGGVTIQTQYGLELISKNTSQKLDFEGYIEAASPLGNSTVEDKKGVIWVGTYKGLFYLRPGEQELKSFQLTTGEQPICNAIAEANNGDLWVGTTNGLYIIHTDQTIANITNNPQDATSLSYNLIHSVYRDQSGLMWVGTANKGLNQYDATRNQFKVLNNNTANGALNDNLIWSVCQLDSKTLLLGTNNGLNKVKLKKAGITTGEFASSNIDTIENWNELFPVFKSTRIGTLLRDNQQQIWVGTYGKGLWKIKPNTDSMVYIPLPQVRDLNVISDLLQDKSGNIWVATFDGIHRIEPNGTIKSYVPDIETSIDKEHNLPTNYFLAVYEDTEGVIWLGGNTAISKYNQQTDTFENYMYDKNNPERSMPFLFAVDFYDDEKGGLWAATFGGGLSRMDKATGTFKHYQSEHGLTSEVIAGIIPDKHGNLWLSHNKGISKFDPEAEQFINFDKGDGVIFNEFALNGFYSNEAGEMFFGCPKGLVIFHPDSIKTNTNLPPVKITGMKVNYKDITTAANEEIYRQFQEDNVLHLYRDHKVIAFEFTALGFRNPEKQKFRYRMKGFDDNWVETTVNNRLATYSNLPPGKYTFEVKASNDNGVWSDKIQSVQIIVHPPFWQTWWFILSAVTFLLVTVILVVRYYSQRKLRKRLRAIETRRKIQAERDRISRDLHDNVGSQITYMISSLDNLSYQLEKKGDSNESGSLNDLSDFARDTMQQLRETIWVLNQDEVSLEELRQKITEFVVKMMAAIPSTQSKVNLQENAEHMLHPSFAIHLFRIVQEAVNNAIKHADAEKIDIQLYMNNTALHITIKDNGAGFNVSQKKAGHFGVDNMKQRTEEMGGVFEIDSVPGTGTTVKVAVPVD